MEHGVIFLMETESIIICCQIFWLILIAIILVVIIRDAFKSKRTLSLLAFATGTMFGLFFRDFLRLFGLI